MNEIARGAVLYFARLAVLVPLLFGSVTAASAEPASHAGHAPAPKLGLGTSVAFDAHHRLWRAAVSGQHLVVSYSDDFGRSFSSPVRVNSTPERIAADGENRPKIAVASNGAVFVTYTMQLSEPYAGHVRLSRSTDGGRSFSAPLTVNDNRDSISHRFESLALDAEGDPHIIWIDKRDQAKAGKQYTGAALYYATMDDGWRVGANKKIIDHSCECCRIAMTFDGDGAPIIAWRHIFGRNTRDHALLRLDGRSAPIRVAEDDWEIDGCPHHGPALAVGNGTYHVAWFSGSDKRQGLFYARSVDRKSFSEPRPIGHPEARTGHPSLLALGERTFLAWSEFVDGRSAIRVMRSDDAGRTWSQPRTAATCTGGADYPQLVNDGDAVYLSWNTSTEGYQLVALGQ